MSPIAPMSLQDQLRKLTQGGPGVTHIASETLFEDCANRLDQLEAALCEIRFGELQCDYCQENMRIARAALSAAQPPKAGGEKL